MLNLLNENCQNPRTKAYNIQENYDFAYSTHKAQTKHKLNSFPHTLTTIQC